MVKSLRSLFKESRLSKFTRIHAGRSNNSITFEGSEEGTSSLYSVPGNQRALKDKPFSLIPSAIAVERPKAFKLTNPYLLSQDIASKQSDI